MFALFLDFDGTVIHNSSWDVVREYYGIDSSGWLEKLKEGEVTVQQWYERDMKLIFSRFRKEDLNRLMGNLEVRKGFNEFKNKYFPKFDKVAVISSGFPDIVKRFSDECGVASFISTYALDKEGFSGRVLGGDDKAELMKKFSRNYKVIYVADEPFKGYEVDEYDEDVLRICMGKGDSRLVVNDFREAGKLIDKVLAAPQKYFK